MQKMKVSKILFLLCVTLLLMFSLAAEAMLWDNGYGEMKGGLVIDRMSVTFRNLRSIIFVLGFLTLSVLLVLSFFKKIRKKCLKISGILVIFLFIVAVAGQIFDYVTHKDIESLDTSDLNTEATNILEDQKTNYPKVGDTVESTYKTHGLCDMASYSNSYGNPELMHKAEDEFMSKLEERTEDDLSDIKCEYDETLLTRCAYKGWDRAVDLLLAKGVNVNAKGYKGNTALHWAYLKLNELKNCTGEYCLKQAKYQKIIDSLLKYGASKTTLNQESKIPEETEMKY